MRERKEIENQSLRKTPPSDEPIKVDGFGQVLALLQAADPEFRDSLLKRLAQRDLNLARSLLAQLRKTN